MTDDIAGQEFFGEFLARVRLECNLTWVQLGSILGRGQAKVGEYMRGQSLLRVGYGPSRTPPLDALRRLADATGYSAGYVLACWQASLDGLGRWRLKVCQRGHEMPQDVPRGTPCRKCEESRNAAYRDSGRRAELAQARLARLGPCTACGSPGGHPETGLCDACARSQRRYGDPLASTRQNKAGFRGVRFDAIQRGPRPWVAWITYKGSKYYLGRHATAQEAAQAYDAKALELRGLRARLNFPENRT